MVNKPVSRSVLYWYWIFSFVDVVKISALSFSLTLSASNLLRKLFDGLMMAIMPTEAVRGRFVRDMESVGKKRSRRWACSWLKEHFEINVIY